jgi:hypothetical protein
METHIVARQLSGVLSNYALLLDVSGTSGELKSIGISNGIAYHHFRVTIDGNVLVDARLSGTASGDVRSNAGLAMGVRFANSLRIDTAGSVTTSLPTYWVVATTDGSKLIALEVFTSEVGGIQQRLEPPHLSK